MQAQTQLQYTITTFAGTGTAGFTADGGAANGAGLGGPFGVAVDGSGNVYIADQYNNRVRKVAGGNISTVAGTGVNAFSGDGKAATAATLSAPDGVALDATGNLYISDSSNYVVRKVSTSGTITTVAGVQTQGPGFAGDTGPATSAVLSHPAALALDSAGNLYIADPGNNAVRMVSTTGIITTVVGATPPGFTGDGGVARNARLNNPIGLAIDRAGNIYIGDSGNNRIRMISSSTGLITTIAGTGVAGRAGDGGPAAKAQLNNPKGVAVDAAGNIYIADSFNNRIRVIGTNGVISTVAGTGVSGYSGDGGVATTGQLFYPSGLAIDKTGLIYVADNQNNVVRLLAPVAGLPVISQGGVSAAAAFGGGSSVSPGDWIEIYGMQFAQNSRGWGGADFNGDSAPTTLDGVSVAIGGQSAFVDFISAGQVNAQLPQNLGTGPQQLTVTTPMGTSASYQVNVNTVQPGILAPAAFNLGGTQYAAALFPDGVTFVAPANSIAGVSSRVAKIGDTVTFYGIGFGAVIPAIPAGQVARQSSALAMPLTVAIGGIQASVQYAGLVQGQVGLYQFNVVIPAAAAGNSVPVVFTVAGNPIAQTLYLAIGS